MARFRKKPVVINAEQFVENEPCSPELIKRIIQDALKSRRINREFKKILEAVLFG